MIVALMDKDWYSPGEVHFTRVTALWLIQNLSTLREGNWPPEASNYVDLPGFGKHKAYFETPVEYAAEITSRLEKCIIRGVPDGLILLALECWCESEESLSKYFRMPVWSIRKRAKGALSFVASGQNRRWHDTEKRAAEDYPTFRALRGKKK